MNEIVRYKQRHDPANSSDLDISNWLRIKDLRIELMKDSLNKTSLFTQIKEAINRENYNLVSELQKTIYEKMDRLRDLYTSYRKNLLD